MSSLIEYDKISCKRSQFNNGTNSHTIIPNQSSTNNYTITLPPFMGTNGQILENTGSAVLSWNDIPYGTGPTGPTGPEIPASTGPTGPISSAGSQLLQFSYGSATWVGTQQLSTTTLTATQNLTSGIHRSTDVSGNLLRVQNSSPEYYQVIASGLYKCKDDGGVMETYKVSTSGVETLISRMVESSSTTTPLTGGQGSPTTVTTSTIVELGNNEGIRSKFLVRDTDLPNADRILMQYIVTVVSLKFL
jgi:hypothetical protein